MPLLAIHDLEVEFRLNGRWVRAVDGVSFSIEPGETLCLVGESGCGKSVTALSIGRLLPEPPARYSGGRIEVEGHDILSMSPRELQRIRGGVVSYVFQEPAAALNPVFRVGSQILETLQIHRPAKATQAEVVRLLGDVGIPDPERRARSYPHELSGGMQQRVMIAMAIATEPRLLIADEPTTALDVTIQAQILELLKDLKQRLGMAILLITHNLGLVGEIADRVAVMYAGQIVETAPVGSLLHAPAHPYTRALIQSVPELGHPRERLIAIPGTVPMPGTWPAGCRFAPRCPVVQDDCRTLAPSLKPIAGNRSVRCPHSAPGSTASS
jgi:oligopeptide/dipeptide ABC transporter ATP-binding protein